MTRSDPYSAAGSSYWLAEARQSGAFVVRHLRFRVVPGASGADTPALGTGSSRVVIPKGGSLDSFRVHQDAPGAADIVVAGTGVDKVGIANGAAGTIFAYGGEINDGDAISAASVELDVAGYGVPNVQATADLHEDDLNLVGLNSSGAHIADDTFDLDGSAVSGAVIIDLWVRTPGADPE